MAHYHKNKDMSPKRHVAFSTSPAVMQLDKGRLTGFKGKALCHKYVDKNGRKRYVGGAALKRSEWGP